MKWNQYKNALIMQKAAEYSTVLAISGLVWLNSI